MSIKGYILGIFLLMLSGTYCTAQLEWSFPSLYADSGDVIAVDLSVVGYSDIISSQGTIQFDSEILEYSHADNFELASITGNSFGVSQIDNGLLSFSWYESDLIGKNISDNGTVLTLHFNVIGSPGDFTELKLVSAPVVPEFVDENFVTVSYVQNDGSVSVNGGLSINEVSIKEYSIYPNPIVSQFQIVGEFVEEVQQVKWFNVEGELVLIDRIVEGEMITRDSNLKRGYYYIQVVDGEIIYENRLIQLL